MAKQAGKFRAEWKPPLNDIDHLIRTIYANKLGLLADKEPWPVRIYWNARIAQLKKAMYRDEAHIRKISCMTIREYEQYVREHPEFRRTRFAAEFAGFRGRNTVFFATVDGLSIVLALESFHRDKGGYPESLAALVPQYLPQLPENPFRPEPYTYDREGGDYLLYCLGEEPPGRPPQHFLVYAPKNRRNMI